MDSRFKRFFLPSNSNFDHARSRQILIAVLPFQQRFPERAEHGSAADDKAGTETTSDENAAIYYHVLGTDQCEPHAKPLHSRTYAGLRY